MRTTTLAPKTRRPAPAAPTAHAARACLGAAAALALLAASAAPARAYRPDWRDFSANFVRLNAPAGDAVMQVAVEVRDPADLDPDGQPRRRPADDFAQTVWWGARGFLAAETRDASGRPIWFHLRHGANLVSAAPEGARHVGEWDRAPHHATLAQADGPSLRWALRQYDADGGGPQLRWDPALGAVLGMGRPGAEALFDTEDYKPLGLRSRLHLPGGERELRVTFSDYRTDGAAKYPRVVETTLGGILVTRAVVTSFELTKALDVNGLRERARRLVRPRSNPLDLDSTR